MTLLTVLWWWMAVAMIVACTWALISEERHEDE